MKRPVEACAKVEFLPVNFCLLQRAFRQANEKKDDPHD